MLQDERYFKERFIIMYGMYAGVWYGGMWIEQQ